MKPPVLPIIACLGVLCLSSAVQASESKRTVDYYLTTPSAFEGKEVTLDVACVKPVPWKSPLPDVAFFHAATTDRTDRKPGGEIMVAIPSANAEAFAKKYGTDFKGRTETNTLKGVLTALGGEGRGPKTWIIDATGGLLQKAIADHKFNLPPDGRPGAGPGGQGGPGGHHPPKGQPNN